MSAPRPWQRYVNERHHNCGCMTFFDTLAWSSVIFEACDEHYTCVDGETP